MATPPQSPMPPDAGGAAPQGGAPGAGGIHPSIPDAIGQSGGTAQKLAKLAMDAQKIAGDSPETAPMMREVQNQVRMATMKMIQQRAASQQQTPQI